MRYLIPSLAVITILAVMLFSGATQPASSADCGGYAASCAGSALANCSGARGTNCSGLAAAESCSGSRSRSVLPGLLSRQPLRRIASLPVRAVSRMRVQQVQRLGCGG